MSKLQSQVRAHSVWSDELAEEGGLLLDQQRSQEFRVVRQLVVAAGAGDGGVRWGSTGQVPGHAHVHHQRPPED